MRYLPLFMFMLLAVAPALAQPKKPAQPSRGEPASSAAKKLGDYDDWTAATHQESGQTVCYAFVRAKNSAPAVPGRGQVVLTVTERPSMRDTVAISAGFPYRKDAAVTMQVDTTGLDLYTAQSSAFAKDGKAAVAAFRKGEEALVRSPGPRDGQTIVDTFSLRGFNAAYAEISKACPPK
jgi:hypothetical protein